MNSKELFEEAQDLFLHGHTEESIPMFTKACEAGYEPIISTLSRGVAYLKVKDYPKAVDDFDGVIELEPGNERAFYYRGVAYLNLGDFDKAAADFNRALALNPERGAAFLARGLVNAELGREEEAASDFKAAVAHSATTVEGFDHLYGNTRTLFERSMALLEGERGPLKIVLTPEEVKKLEQWLD